MSLIASTVRQIINSRPWDWAADKEMERKRQHSIRINRARRHAMDEAFVAAVRKLQPVDPKRVAKEVRWKSETRVGERLKALHDMGRLKRYKLKGNSYLYEVAR